MMSSFDFESQGGQAFSSADGFVFQLGANTNTPFGLNNRQQAVRFWKCWFPFSKERVNRTWENLNL